MNTHENASVTKAIADSISFEAAMMKGVDGKIHTRTAVYTILAICDLYMVVTNYGAHRNKDFVISREAVDRYREECGIFDVIALTQGEYEGSPVFVSGLESDEGFRITHQTSRGIKTTDSLLETVKRVILNTTMRKITHVIFQLSMKH